MIEDWKESLDKNNLISALFMDLPKAFDNLSDGLLIAKFRAYGLSLSAEDLLSSHLNNGHQRVKIKANISEWREVKKTAPQGSVIDPCFIVSSLMTCFILLTSVHCTATHMSIPYLLLPGVFMMLFQTWITTISWNGFL